MTTPDRPVASGGASESPPAAPRRRQPGRPLLLDRALLDRIVQTVRVGNYLKTAAAYCGVGYSTLLEWQQKGRDQQERVQAGHPVEEGQELFLELVESVQEAQAAAEVAAVAYWRKGMAEPGQWRAAMEYLARTNPAQWAASSTVHVTDADSEARVASAVDAAVSSLLHGGDGAGEYDPTDLEGAPT